MTFIDRLSQLVRANVHDLLDRAEDPEKMLKLYLRDLRANIESTRAQVITVAAVEKEQAAEIEQTRRRVTEWQQKALAAVNGGKDDLAREALRRKQEHESNLRRFEERHQVQVQLVSKFKSLLQLADSKHRETLALRDELIADTRNARATEKTAELLSRTRLDADPRFDQMRRVTRGRAAKADAQIEMISQSLDAQLAGLDNPSIETELLALKQTARGTTPAEPSRETADELVFSDLPDFDIEHELLRLKRGGPADI